MCLRLSAAWPFAEVRAVDIFGENYSLDFCRLNPNMTVPVLEIEDKVITDSRLIADFLGQRYTGDGDCRAVFAGKAGLLSRFVTLVAGWDEALHAAASQRLTARRVVNRLRLARLRQRYLDAEAVEAEHQASEDESEGSAEENGPVLRPEPWLMDAYIRKIAGIQNIDDALGQFSSGAPSIERLHAQERNRRILDEIWSTADELLQISPEGFLIGGDLTTADAFLVPVLCRLRDAYPQDMDSYLERYPSVSSYWERVQAQEEAQVVVGLTTCGLAGTFLLKRMLPCQLLGVKCGCIRAPDLPEEVEQRIKDVQAELARQ